MTVEWFTPIEILDRVRKTFGGKIDLDPASCEEANKNVKASKFFTKEENGLCQKWHGKVFLNPPYGRDRKNGQAAWSKRMISAYDSEEIEEGILLVNSATGNKWFKPLKERLICFPDFRIKFLSEGKDDPTHSNAIIYFGKNEESFISAFEDLGAVMKMVSVKTHSE
jgi:hypothetical protein